MPVQKNYCSRFVFVQENFLAIQSRDPLRNSYEDGNLVHIYKSNWCAGVKVWKYYRDNRTNELCELVLKRFNTNIKIRKWEF